jgi:hypothetical protein
VKKRSVHQRRRKLLLVGLSLPAHFLFNKPRSITDRRMKKGKSRAVVLSSDG